MAEKRALLAPHLDIDDSRFAFEKIADSTDALLPARDGGVSVDPIGKGVDTLLRQRITRVTFEDAASGQGEVRGRLAEIAGALSRDQDFVVTDLGWSVFHITADSRP